MNALLSSLLSFLLLWPAVAMAQDDAMDFAPVGVEDERELKEEVEEAIKAYKRDDFLRASLILFSIVDRNTLAMSPYEQKAEYMLGKTLFRLNLFQASLNYFDRVVQAGAEHRYFKSTCKWLYYISTKISGEPQLLAKIAKYRPSDCPAEFRSEISFLLGHYHYKEGVRTASEESINSGIRYLKQVLPASQYFPKAKFLEGISYVFLEKPKPAVDAFKDLMRATLDSSRVSEDLEYFNQLAILSMARVFYSTGQFETAAKYYDRVTQDSPLWLDALFEASWTFFRWRNHEKALGNLHTLNSPFFSDEFVPEAGILEAVIFYFNCNYEKTRQAVTNFQVTYEPIRDDIKSRLDESSDDGAFYESLSALEKAGAGSARLNKIVSAAFQDKTLKRLNSYIKELDREIKLITRSRSTWAKSKLADSIVRQTEMVRKRMGREAGRRARGQLQRVYEELVRLIRDSRKIMIEVATSERGIIANRMLGTEGRANRKNKGPLYATDDEHIYWPFNGEYWRDELGYYLYTIKSECGR